MAPPPIVALKDIRLADGPVMLFDGVDLGLEPRVRACLVGRNGAGKSTLMRILAGKIEPDGGERFANPGVRIVAVLQEPEITGETLLDYATAGGAPDWMAQSALTTFGVDPAKSTQGLSAARPAARRWPAPSRRSRTCSCWTSPPTTWTSSLSRRWRRSSAAPRPPP
jgi:ATP-binding cassette subfamily F protein uup